MADKKVSELDAIAGSATAADDLFLIVDASGSVTKKITRAELNNAIEQDVLSTVDINGGTIDSTVIGGTTPAAGDFTTLGATGNITVGGTVDGRDVAADGTKLDGIEASATADQTDAEIRAAVEAASDSNVFTDADHTKLNGIEASADVTDATNVAAAGALMTSGGTITGDITVNDGVDAYFGTSNDGLKIHHSNNNSLIEDVGTGNFLITTNGNNIQLMKNQAEQMLVAKTDGAVELYHDNTKKVETSATGATIADKLTVGSGAAGEVAFSGDTGIDGFRIHNTDGNYLEFRPASTDVPMVLNNVGNVGIGHTSPTVDGTLAGITVPSGAQYLHMHDTVGAVLKLSDPASGANRGAQFAMIGTDTILNNCESGTLIFGTGNAERMRVDTSGNVMASCTATVINQSSVAGLYYANDSYLAVSRSSGSPVVLNRLSTDGSVLTVQKNGSTVGSINAGNGDLLIGTGDVNLRFFDATPAVIPRTASDGTSSAVVDLGNVSNSFKDLYSQRVKGAAGHTGEVHFTGSHDIRFVSNGNEKGRIDSNGFHFGGTDNNPQASSSSSGGELYYSTQYAFMGMYRPSNPCLLLNRTGSDGEIVQFRKSGSTVGTVSVTGSGTTYNTTSDIRLKQDIEPLVATDKLMQMNPVSYNWKADPDGPRSMGFIAQEMQEVMPEAVSTGEDDDAMMSMDYGRITPILVSALQDAHRKIDELAAEIAELKAN